jgi:hypothetical protein
MKTVVYHVNPDFYKNTNTKSMFFRDWLNRFPHPDYDVLLDEGFDTIEFKDDYTQDEYEDVVAFLSREKKTFAHFWNTIDMFVVYAKNSTLCSLMRGGEFFEAYTFDGVLSQQECELHMPYKITKFNYYNWEV